MKKRLCAFVLAIVLGVTCGTKTLAYDRDIHDKDLENILFGNNAYEDIDDYVAKIEDALYLCVDQTVNTGSDEFDDLREWKIRVLPDTIAEISAPGGSSHRRYTHQGWSFYYVQPANTKSTVEWTNEKWELRKHVLLETVEKVFNFNGIPNVFDPLFSVYTEQCESFCRLIYYIHILDDQTAFDYGTYKKECDDICSLADDPRREENFAIIPEIMDCCEVLFLSQQGNVYDGLMGDLQTLNNKAERLLNAGINSEEDFNDYLDCAGKVMETLKDHIPKLLREEEFFANVFYDGAIDIAA